MSEDQASQYRILLELIFGLAAIELQASTAKTSTPVLMALDEAGNIAPPKLQDKLKIGRYRNTPYLLGFQDVSQIKSKFQENGGRAVLAGIKNQIFLPGIDIDTGVYASSLLGSTTVLSRTEVDAPGSQYDAERVSESRRDFKQAPELRRLVKYRQAIAIVDTTAPILFRFLPRADNGTVAHPPHRKPERPQTLAEAVQEMMDRKKAQKDKNEISSNGGNGYRRPSQNPEAGQSVQTNLTKQSELSLTSADSASVRGHLRANAFGQDLSGRDLRVEEDY
jgi:type IV secretory pathway TraG/TraD family ATPase VirD4